MYIELSDGSTPHPTLASAVGAPVAIGGLDGGCVVVEINRVFSSAGANFRGAGRVSARDAVARDASGGGLGAGRGSSKRKLVTKRMKKPLILVTFVRHRGGLWPFKVSILLTDVDRIIEESQGLRKGKSLRERWQFPEFRQSGLASEAENQFFSVEKEMRECPIRIACIPEFTRANEPQRLLDLNRRGLPQRYLLQH